VQQRALTFASILAAAGALAGFAAAAPKKPAPVERPAPRHQLTQVLQQRLAAPTANPGWRQRPRLVVLISIDQFRADYIPRFRELYLPARTGNEVGGFRFLQDLGAWYPDCQYEHHRTVTAVGHAILGTGAQPYLNGIVGNNWWDRTTGKSVYCVDDAKSQVVGLTEGSKEKPMSPANLLATTFGDELELATGGRSRTVAVSLKDRASILMIGHRADVPIWFDETTGGWVSSTFYFKDGKLPAWVEELNGRRLADTMRQTPWTPSVDSAALERIWEPKPGALNFSHRLTGSDYNAFLTSPGGNEFTLESARQAVVSEKLGQDDVPDVLAINLSSNDYVGHKYGPDSAEVLDISVQTDRQLSKFFNFLNKSVPGGLQSVTIALSADHGVVTVPELNAASGVPASRSITSAVRDAADKALDAAVGPANWIASTDNGELYFAPAAVAAYPDESRARLENLVAPAIRDIPGVYWAYGKSSILAGTAPQNALGARMARGVHPDRSGDVVVILDPQWLPGAAAVGTGTSHGTPFTYDTHVALLMAGAGVKPGTYRSRVSPARVAPSLSFLLGVNRPSAADEPLLPGLFGTE
jgi:hypothetical protein